MLAQIASDLKAQMPDLRGFSASSLKNMRQFYTAYEQNQIGQLLTVQLQAADKQKDIIGQLPTVQLPINNTADNWHSSTTQVDDSILSNFSQLLSLIT